MSIPTAKIIAIFYSNNEILIPREEQDEDSSEQTAVVCQNDSNEIFKTKILIYSVKNISSSDLIKNLNPKGNNKMAYATSSRPIKEVETEVISNIKNCLEKIF